MSNVHVIDADEWDFCDVPASKSAGTASTDLSHPLYENNVCLNHYRVSALVKMYPLLPQSMGLVPPTRLPSSKAFLTLIDCAPTK